MVDGAELVLDWHVRVELCRLDLKADTGRPHSDSERFLLERRDQRVVVCNEVKDPDEIDIGPS